MPNMSESCGTQIAPEAPMYKYDRVRLKTFQSWPANAKVEAWKMARIGSSAAGASNRNTSFTAPPPPTGMGESSENETEGSTESACEKTSILSVLFPSGGLESTELSKR